MSCWLRYLTWNIQRSQRQEAISCGRGQQAESSPRSGQAPVFKKDQIIAQFLVGQSKKPGRVIPDRALAETIQHEFLVREHSLILAAAVLVNDPLAGLFIDLIALAAGFRQVFRRRLVAVSQQNHWLIIRI